MSTDTKILQFAPMQSFVNPTFWHKLAEIKLDYDRLCDEPKSIWGYYTNRNNNSCLLEVDYTAFNNDFREPKFCFKACGTIYNKNTLEDFKSCDKTALLKEEGVKLIKDFESDKILNDPSYLARFFIISFADLRTYSYYHWFCFPCPLNNTFKLLTPATKLKYNAEEHYLIKQALNTRNAEYKENFCILLASVKEQKFFTLKEFVDTFKSVEDVDLQSVYFCFADNSEYEEPSWLMRTFANFLFYKCPFLLQQTIKFVGLRCDNQLNLDESLLWHIEELERCDLSLNNDSINFVGWELNRNLKAMPRMVNMKESMDPTLLAENSINLNLKLMKWRLLPDLKLNIIAQTKCLLFGAGTLGCAVARMLLGWGFKHITFIDNGKVNYSNPVRQYLYTHADAVKGNTMKALTAAERVKEINPTTIAAGYVVHIPMPGHPIGEVLKQQTETDLNVIKDLVAAHDVLFLLTDSRESRWLPTVMGAVYNKIVINAALGFDSYLVQRHGGGGKLVEEIGDTITNAAPLVQVWNMKCIPGQDLGCYFCNEITAPSNSQKDRTLDQQCTVTRPGVSNIAASYAVELLVALLHHPLQRHAPAYYATSHTLSLKVRENLPETSLGIIPHSIRGSITNYENLLPASPKFNKCIACSQEVIKAFTEDGHDFLYKVFESGKFLEDLTGISEDIIKLSDEMIDYLSDTDSYVEISD